MKKSPDKIWALRNTGTIKYKWLRLSEILGKPVGRLVAYVLEDWLSQYIEEIKNPGTRAALVQELERASKHYEEVVQKNHTNDIYKGLETPQVRTSMNIRNMPVETRMFIKALAYQHGLTIPEFLTEVVAKELESEGGKTQRPGLNARVRKDIERLSQAIKMEKKKTKGSRRKS